MTRFVFDQTGWAQVHITAQSHVVPKKKEYLPAMAWRRGVVTMVVVVVAVAEVEVVLAPKWNDKGRMSKGV